MATFAEFMSRAERTAYASEIGKVFTARGWVLQHTGGGCLAWEKMTEGKRHYAWITVDDEVQSSDESGFDVADAEATPWTCGIYALDEEGSLDDTTEVYKTITGLGAAIAWCELRLSLPNPTEEIAR